MTGQKQEARTIRSGLLCRSVDQTRTRGPWLSGAVWSAPHQQVKVIELSSTPVTMLRKMSWVRSQAVQWWVKFMAVVLSESLYSQYVAGRAIEVALLSSI